jgi:hypothetical protein
MPNEDYEKRKAEDERVLHEWDVESLRKMIEKMPPAQRREARLVIADRTFTVDELLREAERGTKYGKMILQAQAKLRLEQLRRK